MSIFGKIAAAFGAKRPPGPGEAPGRNDPCWCGSGEKYKRCHLDADQRRLQAQRSSCCTTT